MAIADLVYEQTKKLPEPSHEGNPFLRGTGVAKAALYRAINCVSRSSPRPCRRHIREDGRIRHWGALIGARGGKTRILWVVTLADGESIHDAFFNRNFRKDEP